MLASECIHVSNSRTHVEPQPARPVLVRGSEWSLRNTNCPDIPRHGEGTNIGTDHQNRNNNISNTHDSLLQCNFSKACDGNANFSSCILFLKDLSMKMLCDMMHQRCSVNDLYSIIIFTGYSIHLSSSFPLVRRIFSMSISSESYLWFLFALRMCFLGTYFIMCYGR